MQKDFLGRLVRAGFTSNQARTRFKNLSQLGWSGEVGTLWEIIEYCKEQRENPYETDARQKSADKLRRDILYRFTSMGMLDGYCWNPYGGDMGVACMLEWLQFPELYNDVELSLAVEKWYSECLNGNDELYRHSVVLLEQYNTSHIHDSVRSLMLRKLGPLALTYGDYDLALEKAQELSQRIDPLDQIQGLKHTGTAIAHIEFDGIAEKSMPSFNLARKLLSKAKLGTERSIQIALDISRNVVRMLTRASIVNGFSIDLGSSGLDATAELDTYRSLLRLAGSHDPKVRALDYDTLARGIAVLTQNCRTARMYSDFAAMLYGRDAAERGEEGWAQIDLYRHFGTQAVIAVVEGIRDGNSEKLTEADNWLDDLIDEIGAAQMKHSRVFCLSVRLSVENIRRGRLGHLD